MMFHCEGKKIYLALAACLVLAIFPPGFLEGREARQRVSSPGEYSGYSETVYKGVITRSEYVAMRDGVKIAVDYMLPKGLSPTGKIPAILVQTRYWRSMVIPIMKDEAHKFLVEHGYAVVKVDVRGTGASFGTWPYPWSEDEVRDGAEIVDWIIRQPWSDGKVGTYGNSYVATSAEFLLTNKHPAVKAAVIRYGLWDSYTDIVYPGGIYHDWFMDTWNKVDHALDADDVGSLLKFIKLPVPFKGAFPGVKPVRGPEGKKMLAAAIKGHAQNGDVYQSGKQVEFRDDLSPQWGEPTAKISPFYYMKELEESGAAIYSYSGWLDGAYTLAAVNRYLNLNNRRKLTIGPWPHGGRENISPWRKSDKQEFDHNAELLRFFDYHLKGIQNGVMEEEPVHYYTMGEEKWKAAASWPPRARATNYYFSENRGLSRNRPRATGAFDTYKVDYNAGSGNASRFNSLVNLERVPIGYPDRAEADKLLQVYETAPLGVDMEVTGHPVVSLYISSTAKDGQFFVYLEDVAPDGTVSYITEGMLRAYCRGGSEEKRPYKTAPGIPYHTFKRKNARPMEPGKAALITFDLQPTSALFKRGHRIRVAIAGADKDHFMLPQGPEPVIRIYRGATKPSSITLPVVTKK